MKYEDINIGESYHIEFHSKARDFSGVAKCVDKVPEVQWPFPMDKNGGRPAHICFENPGEGVGFLVRPEAVRQIGNRISPSYYVVGVLCIPPKQASRWPNGTIICAKYVDIDLEDLKKAFSLSLISLGIGTDALIYVCYNVKEFQDLIHDSIMSIHGSPQTALVIDGENNVVKEVPLNDLYRHIN